MTVLSFSAKLSVGGFDLRVKLKKMSLHHAGTEILEENRKRTIIALQELNMGLLAEMHYTRVRTIEHLNLSRNEGPFVGLQQYR